MNDATSRDPITAASVALDCIMQVTGTDRFAAECYFMNELTRRHSPTAPVRMWLFERAQDHGWNPIYLEANGKKRLETDAPPEANLGYLISSSDVAVLDIDTTDWKSTLFELVPAMRTRIETAAIVQTPRGAHVYFRPVGIAARVVGRWKHANLPITLIRNGHVVAPGSVIDGQLYTYLGRDSYFRYERLDYLTLPETGWGSDFKDPLSPDYSYYSFDFS